MENLSHTCSPMFLSSVLLLYVVLWSDAVFPLQCAAVLQTQGQRLVPRASVGNMREWVRVGIGDRRTERDCFPFQIMM